MSSLITDHSDHSLSKTERKALAKPDSFTSYFKKLVEDLQKHRGTQVTVVLIIAAIASAVGWWSSHRVAVSVEGMDELFSAREQADKELTAAAAAIPAPPAESKSEAKPDPKASSAAPATLSPELARYTPMDVEAKFSGSLAAYKKVIAGHPGTHASMQANFALADLYFDHGAAERSIEFYKAAVAAAPTAFYKMLGGYSLASAFFETGKLDESLAAIETAKNTGAKEMRGELLFLQARVLEKKKDSAGAKKVYELIEKDFGEGTPTGQMASKRKALL